VFICASLRELLSESLNIYNNWMLLRARHPFCLAVLSPQRASVSTHTHTHTHTLSLHTILMSLPAPLIISSIFMAGTTDQPPPSLFLPSQTFDVSVMNMYVFVSNVQRLRMAVKSTCTFLNHYLSFPSMIYVRKYQDIKKR